MKRRILSLILLIISFSMVGCGNGKKLEQANQKLAEANSTISELESDKISLQSQVDALKQDATLNPSADLLSQQLNIANRKIAELEEKLNDSSTEKSSKTFLETVFWSDGNVYQVANDIKLYTDSFCSKESTLNRTNILISSPIILKIQLSNQNTAYVIASRDGLIYSTQKPSLKVNQEKTLLDNTHLSDNNLNEEFIATLFWSDGNTYTYNSNKYKFYTDCYCSNPMNDITTLSSSIIIEVDMSNQLTVYALMSENGLVFTAKKPSLTKK